ncbi:ABC transporter [Synechococcales cyanobacterium C]|uniref:ABC transporter n=1 Tax=Petrachloros mirabilis ULC683 TaxID=2781853 RepID=A0A8K2AC91_9CYAN|nr:NIL domain-containing protein [Petrachloros mirabilis]NCJ05264.1 ABC transporter [Petrachloros mirabilis ULC683]
MSAALNLLLHADGSSPPHNWPSGQTGSGKPQTIYKRIRIQVPPEYSGEPVIANLAVMHELEVNILGAFLATHSKESGWFDLQLRGTSARMEAGLAYLRTLEIEVLADDDRPTPDWSFR